MAGFLGLGGTTEEFFLDPDDAKSFGDIEYMRTPKKVKHTFPNTKGWGKVEDSEKTVSAYDEKSGVPSANTQSTGSFASSTASQSSASVPASRPASVDSSMDMFRQMAKKMK